MYVTDFICTYKHLDESSEEADLLYQSQFLQIFGCENGYNDKEITKGLKEARQIMESHPVGKEFLYEAYRQGLPPALSIFASLGGEDKNSFMDTIVRSYYGWPSMDLIHTFVCKIKNGNEIGVNDYRNILSEYKRLYKF